MEDAKQKEEEKKALHFLPANQEMTTFGRNMFFGIIKQEQQVIACC